MEIREVETHFSNPRSTHLAFLVTLTLFSFEGTPSIAICSGLCYSDHDDEKVQKHTCYVLRNVAGMIIYIFSNVL